MSVMTSFAADRSRRTTETDRWLAGMLGAEPGVALVAVGGYGRKELLPGSDLDVLMLHDGRDGIARIADRIWYPVWDSGARLDHAVRTVPQARRVARSDLKVVLGLLHARHVAGDADLTTRLREGALEDWRANARTRLTELKALHEERTRLHGELAYLLEPDLKESRGGQRDVHAIQAIAAAWVAPARRRSVRSGSPATCRADSSPSATFRSVRATRRACGTVRTAWSSSAPESQTGYQIRSATPAMSSRPPCSSTTSRSLRGSSSRRPYPPTATRATPGSAPRSSASHRSTCAVRRARSAANEVKV